MITRFAINITDATDCMHIGGQPETRTYIFELPIEAIRLLKKTDENKKSGCFIGMSLSFVNDEQIKPVCKKCNGTGKLTRTFTGSIGLENQWRPSGQGGREDEYKPCPDCKKGGE